MTKKIKKIHKNDEQEFLIENLKNITEVQYQKLSEQLRNVPIENLPLWREACTANASVYQSIEPLTSSIKAGDEKAYAAGERILKQGRVGCLILAGGLGSRLGYEGPKGTYPLDEKGNTLFKLHCQKILAAHCKYGKILPIAIMTSDANDVVTRQYFTTHDYFGLGRENVFFFKQRSLPFLNKDGNLFLDREDHLAVGPNGNGELLHLFVDSPFYREWKNKGIDILTMIPVDNALAEPFDVELIGHHYLNKNEVSLNVIEKKDPNEKVGVLARKEGKIIVVEYSEMDPIEVRALDDKGKLKYRLASINLFAFSMAFAEKVAKVNMPLHAAWKRCPYLDGQGRVCNPEKPNAWKIETFLFDVLPLTDRVGIIVAEREKCFAPLKNKEGPDSPESLRHAGITG